MTDDYATNAIAIRQRVDRKEAAYLFAERVAIKMMDSGTAESKARLEAFEELTARAAGYSV